MYCHTGLPLDKPLTVTRSEFHDDPARDYDLALLFLGDSTYKADFFTDIPETTTQINVQRGIVLHADEIRTIKLNQGGVFLIRIRK